MIYVRRLEVHWIVVGNLVVKWEIESFLRFNKQIYRKSGHVLKRFYLTKFREVDGDIRDCTKTLVCPDFLTWKGRVSVGIRSVILIKKPPLHHSLLRTLVKINMVVENTLSTLHKSRFRVNEDGKEINDCNPVRRPLF